MSAESSSRGHRRTSCRNVPTWACAQQYRHAPKFDYIVLDITTAGLDHISSNYELSCILTAGSAFPQRQERPSAAIQ